MPGKRHPSHGNKDMWEFRIQQTTAAQSSAGCREAALAFGEGGSAGATLPAPVSRWDCQLRAEGSWAGRDLKEGPSSRHPCHQRSTFPPSQPGLEQFHEWGSHSSSGSRNSSGQQETCRNGFPLRGSVGTCGTAAPWKALFGEELFHSGKLIQPPQTPLGANRDKAGDT